uniref:Si:dkey-43f9.4 n=1 Tax=Nothobranchius korthausae TaxID=1143690 RepID=A0A1A8ERF1_9TELE
MEHPAFKKLNNGTLILKASDEAKAVVPQRQGYRAKQPEEVEGEARAHVASEGGDVNNATLVLSRWKVQFGTYQGKTFHWLLQNDVGYAVMVVASHQKERERTGSQSPLMANKVCQLPKNDGASSRLTDGERRPLREEEGQTEGGRYHCFCRYQHHLHPSGCILLQLQQSVRLSFLPGAEGCIPICSLCVWAFSVCGGNAGKSKKDGGR